LISFLNKKMATSSGRWDDVGLAEWHSPVKVRPSAEEKRGGKETNSVRRHGFDSAATEMPRLSADSFSSAALKRERMK
jgi:hypothetical protein